MIQKKAKKEQKRGKGGGSERETVGDASEERKKQGDGEREGKERTMQL